MVMLTEIQFQQLVDNLQQSIETILDEASLDIDIDNANGVLTITFENNSSLILSRQLALRQLWVAAKSGGYHFDFQIETQQWLIKATGETLFSVLQKVIKEQAGISIDFD